MISVAAVLQARMTSTRMPGKSLLPLAGVPLIEHIINRLKAVANLDHIVLAVPDLQSEQYDSFLHHPDTAVFALRLDNGAIAS